MQMVFAIFDLCFIFGLMLYRCGGVFFAFDTPVLEEDLEGSQRCYVAGCVYDLTGYCFRIIPLCGKSVMYRRPSD
jgi:hypothetical protein